MPPPYAARWAELLPNARVVRVPEAAHMGLYEQPDVFASEVCAFLG
jgi:pimeloyl-ACP methyl ester carboxylesterase